jgi:hypothetical protein
MRQLARVNDDTDFDDPFGSSFVLPADHAEIELACVTTTVVPLPYPELNILLPDYEVEDIVFGYDTLDIHTLPSIEPVVQPDYSTTTAILSLFGTNP